MNKCRQCGRLFEEELEFCPHDGTRLRQRRSPAPGDDPEDPLIGTVIDQRFEVRSRLGHGGMGSVYRALQTSTRREVALKVIRGEVTEELAKRFLREGLTTSALPNIHTVTTFDFGRDPAGRLYLAMELLKGRPLDAVIRREGALHWQRAVRIVSQVAESLAEAHDKGIVHRDLKPPNIFLTKMGTESDFVKVLDFGIAKYDGSGVTTELTGAGMVLGTARYMPPEQARGQEVGPGSDLYSLGIVLYEMLSGQAPFQADTPLAMLMKHCQDPVPPLQSYRPGLEIPAALQRLLDNLSRKTPTFG